MAQRGGSSRIGMLVVQGALLALTIGQLWVQRFSDRTAWSAVTAAAGTVIAVFLAFWIGANIWIATAGLRAPSHASRDEPSVTSRGPASSRENFATGPQTQRLQRPSRRQQP